MEWPGLRRVWCIFSLVSLGISEWPWTGTGQAPAECVNPWQVCAYTSGEGVPGGHIQTLWLKVEGVFVPLLERP